MTGVQTCALPILFELNDGGKRFFDKCEVLIPGLAGQEMKNNRDVERRNVELIFEKGVFLFCFYLTYCAFC